MEYFTYINPYNLVAVIIFVDASAIHIQRNNLHGVLLLFSKLFDVIDIENIEKVQTAD